MGAFEVDLTGPDPTHELAWNRLRRQLSDHKKRIDSWVALGPDRMQGNFMLAAVKQDPDFARVRALWGSSAEFRGYLKEKFTFHYGAEYTKRLISIFLA